MNAHKQWIWKLLTWFTWELTWHEASLRSSISSELQYLVSSSVSSFILDWIFSWNMKTQNCARTLFLYLGLTKHQWTKSLHLNNVNLARGFLEAIYSIYLVSSCVSLFILNLIISILSWNMKSVRELFSSTWGYTSIMSFPPPKTFEYLRAWPHCEVNKKTNGRKLLRKWTW